MQAAAFLIYYEDKEKETNLVSTNKQHQPTLTRLNAFT
jgi:hypothetical protein